jgi:hypothetical protein
LNRTPDQKGSYLSLIQECRVQAKKEAYPPKGNNAHESEEGARFWKKWYEDVSVVDDRKKRPIFRLLDPSKLFLAPAQESVIFKDATTNDLVMIVIRNFVPSQDVVDLISRECLQALNTRRSIRVCLLLSLISAH